jgi:RNA polymerase sigma factor (sigma-70 family)
LLNNNELHIIIQGCIDQNRRSQQEFYKIFYGYGAGICMRYSHKKDDLVEIVNDGFLKVFKEFQSFKIPNAHFENTLRSWVRKIMINTSIDYYRKYVKYEPTIVDVDDKAESLEFVSETPLEKLTYDEVVKLVHQLTPMYRVVFNMFVIDGLSHDEIAKELNISPGTSKSNLSKARINMMKLIENKHNTLV